MNWLDKKVPEHATVDFNIHSSTRVGYTTTHSLTAAIDKAEGLYRECGTPITVVIDLVVMRYGKIQSQRSVYLYQRSKPWQPPVNALPVPAPSTWQHKYSS